MANDRMWLVHRPTGKKALIAKSFGRGWAEYTGERHAHYSVDGLLTECGRDDNTDFVIEYESD